MPVDSTKSTTWGEKSCLMYFILFKINNIILIFELGLEFVSGKNDNFKFKIPENDRPCCFINILDYVTYSDVQVIQKGSVFKLFSFLFWFLWQARGTPKCLTWPWFRHCTGTRWHCSFPIDSMLVPHKITVPPWDTDVWENIWTKIYERSRRDVLGKFLKRFLEHDIHVHEGEGALFILERWCTICVVGKLKSSHLTQASFLSTFLIF